MYIYITFSAILIMLASLIGVIFIWKGFGQFLQKNTKYLTTFAIGVFVVVAYSLCVETLHLTGSIILAFSSIIGGIIFLQIATYFMPHHHHDTDDCCPEHHTIINAKRILLGDAIHNIGDGILLVSAFMINVHIGIFAALGILLHELVQEIAEFFILKEAGYSTKKALMYNFIIAGTIFIGVAIGLFVSQIPFINIIFIGLAAGGFVYILVADLLPHTLYSMKISGNKKIHIFIGTLGAMIMLSIGFIAPHSHEHDHEGEILHDEHDTISDHDHISEEMDHK